MKAYDATSVCDWSVWMSRAGTRRDHERKKREEAFSVQSDAGIS